jgi:DNA-binding transcriptional ArsR family regulator
MKRRRMPETQYRASRVCRILGNPTAYQIIRALNHSVKTPSQLAVEIGVPIPTVSDTLRNLRNINLVRYEPKLNERAYWLKDSAVLEILEKVEFFVKRMRIKKW